MNILKFYQTLKAITISSKILNCSFGEYDSLLLHYLKDKKVDYDFIQKLPKQDVLFDDFSVISPQALHYLIDYVDVNHIDRKGKTIGFIALEKGLIDKSEYILSHLHDKNGTYLLMAFNQALNSNKGNEYISLIDKLLTESSFSFCQNVVADKFVFRITHFDSEELSIQKNEKQSLPLALFNQFLISSTSFDYRLQLWNKIIEHPKMTKEYIKEIQLHWEELIVQESYVSDSYWLHFVQNDLHLSEEKLQTINLSLEKAIIHSSFSYKTKTEPTKTNRIKI